MRKQAAFAVTLREAVHREPRICSCAATREHLVSLSDYADTSPRARTGLSDYASGERCGAGEWFLGVVVVLVVFCISRF